MMLIHCLVRPVDTHIHRLASRWGLSAGVNVTQTEADLKRLFDEQYWNDVHLQIIFYGREYGKAGQKYPYTGNTHIVNNSDAKLR